MKIERKMRKENRMKMTCVIAENGLVAGRIKREKARGLLWLYKSTVEKEECITNPEKPGKSGVIKKKEGKIGK